MKKKCLGKEVDKIKSNGGLHTASEISGQPDLWVKTFQEIISQKEDLMSFFKRVFNARQANVVLTGAGTSAFIGEVAESLLQRHWSHSVRALSTTTLVTHFKEYIELDKPLLLISFARSGNSPESTATVELAEKFCEKEVFHLIITCNAEGKLAQKVSDKKSFLFLMPPEAEDQSLAMTGSFTSMLLAILLMGRLDEIAALEDDLQLLSEFGEGFIKKYSSQIEEISNLGFTRAVFLGSGSRLGIARESHLKLQELTDGKVICKYDSFLGFRHGPKAVIDEQTLIVYLFSENSYVLQYEKDLVGSINNKGLGLASLGIGTQSMKEIETDYMLEFGPPESEAPDSELLPILSVLPAQILGFFSSLKYGLEPDTPSASGAISRVVEGVTIYPAANNQ